VNLVRSADRPEFRERANLSAQVFLEFLLHHRLAYL
jgi:hypothetical protein